MINRIIIKGKRMHRSIIILLAFVALTCLPAQAKQSSVPALDQTELCSNLAQRFTQHPDLTGVKDSDFHIEAQHTIQVGPNTYYAVKVGLIANAQKVTSLPFPMTFVTDPTGTLLFGSTINLKTGKEAILSQSPNVTRIDFPASVTPSTFVTGTGKADVIFAADPFCPHCRQGYTFLSTHLNSIERIRLAHNPLEPSNGSAIAAWVMEHALNTNTQPWDVVEFSFSELKPVSPVKKNGARLSSDDISMNILAQYKKRFPQLFKSVNGDLGKAYDMLIKKYAQKQIQAHSQLKKAGFKSSPIFIIDGQVIKGMNQQSLASALNGDLALSNKGELCDDDCTQ